MDARSFVHLFHIIIVGGLFLYVGIKKTEIPNFMYSFLLLLGIIIILYCEIYKITFALIFIEFKFRFSRLEQNFLLSFAQFHQLFAL